MPSLVEASNTASYDDPIAEGIKKTDCHDKIQSSKQESADKIFEQLEYEVRPAELEKVENEVAGKVMNILANYFWDANDEAGISRQTYWPGEAIFKCHALHWIRLKQPVQMVLPAFPFKSINRDKVLSDLPDFAEYLGLSKLNQMCLDVRKVYEHGAQITLATDGVVFNDLVLVDDKSVWKYSQGVRDMVEKNYFHQNLHVVHAMELLGYVKREELTEEKFYESTVQTRNQIIAQFTQHEEAMQALIDSDPDSNLTYTGIKTFCKIDQANSIYRTQAPSKKAFLRDMSSLALKILARSEGFGKLIRDKLPKHIRLSIHPSSGVAKLSICLLPQPAGGVSRAPWMCAIAVDEKGDYISAHSKDARGDHEMVYNNGKPWLLRQRKFFEGLDGTQLSQWRVEYLYPGGLRIWHNGGPVNGNLASARSDCALPTALVDKLKVISLWQRVQVIEA